MAQIAAFNLTEVKSNDLLPAGSYKMAITKTSAAPSKKNPDNLVFTFEMDVQDGQYQGRKIFTRLNLVSDNQTAKDMAQRELKNIVEACKLPMLKGDTDELLGIPFMADVVIVPSKDPQYSDSNIIKKYHAIGGASVAAAPEAAAGPWSR